MCNAQVQFIFEFIIVYNCKFARLIINLHELYFPAFAITIRDKSSVIRVIYKFMHTHEF